MKTVLTIAGSDPSGGAGIQADLRVFSDFGVRGLSVITALTAQNTGKVRSVVPVAPGFVAEQVYALLEEFSVDAVKIGMLAKGETVRTVAGLLRNTALKDSMVVLDTIILSSGGYPLLDNKGVEELKGLFPLATVVTPNIFEAQRLTSIDIRGHSDMERAALSIAEMGAQGVVIKGGHIKGPPVDLLYWKKRFHRFESKRIRARAATLHGTGCRFSSALAAGLAKGRGLKRAVEDAKTYVEETIRRGPRP